MKNAPSYDVGCIQTLFEGFAVAFLCREGVIDPNAYVGEYLPELCFESARAPGRRIKVRNLLTHSTGYHAPSGIASKAGFPTWQHLVDYLSHSSEAFPPGTVCSWNGLGRGILIPLVERVTGSRMHDIVLELVCRNSGVNAVVSNEDSGWPSIMLTLTDIVRVIDTVLSSESLGLLSRLEAEKVPVVRRCVSSRSGNPVAYSWGLALFADGLWGQIGNGRSYSMGIRFDASLSFMTALSIGAASFARDLVLQFICGANGFLRPLGPDHALGSIVECDLADISGSYSGDVGDRVDVSVSGDMIEYQVYRGNEHVASVPMRLADDGVLVGDGRWDAFQVEFFPHPESGKPCLMLGQVAYRR